ncbi:MAG: hypothetical protein QOG85_56 [Gaiellaceae bacterium]|jgi:hypothetical protein|nr:hypothetical protein [Gaiellaceae bacterium]
MRTKAYCLFVAVIGLVALVSGSSAATQKASDVARIDTSTRASIVQYLRSIHVDPRGLVIQRGARNYAGAHCPGARWNCTATTHPVVQVAAAGGRNRFLCSTGKCAVVQVAAITTATNVAKCIQTDGPETCTINQASAKANNKAVVYQRASNSTGVVTVVPTSKVLIAESATSKVSIIQKATGSAIAPNSNEACVYQAITLARAGTFHKNTVILTQAAHQRVTIKQDSKNGGNSASESATSAGQCTGGSITQRQTLRSTLTVPSSITQNQNAADNGANMTVDIEQNQSIGFLGTAHGENSANFDQYNSLTAVANSPDGPVSQTQSSSTGGLLGTLNQDSREVSTATTAQTEIQCQDAATIGPTTCGSVSEAPGSVTQTQFGPVHKAGTRVHKGVGTSTQTGNGPTRSRSASRRHRATPPERARRMTSRATAARPATARSPRTPTSTA